jgi:hypothetical protein
MKSISTVFAALALFAGSATAQAPAAPLASQETNWAGITADLTEFRRKGNTLTAKLRFTVPAGGSRGQYEIAWPEVYLIDAAAGKKYEVLKDDQGTYLAATRAGYKEKIWGDIEPGQSATVWMKFPAPPADVKEIGLSLPSMAPFEDIAIQE